ncbi:MAG: hypothetical protein LBD91_08640 [Prevotellaceae bacterium]|jgi:hypothetical protein|nr:hypothetical protein [Prevotellaceae bacterium]
MNALKILLSLVDAGLTLTLFAQTQECGTALTEEDIAYLRSTRGSDPSRQMASPSSVGSAALTIKGIGKYIGEIVTTFNIEREIEQ